MKIYYRISDGSYNKPKLPGANKKFCFKNFSNQFPNNETTIIADNVSDSYDIIKNCPNLVKTQLGNAGSLMHSIKLAIELPENKAIYFVEDDYIHNNNSRQLIYEGLGIADYVTLYDHPDKYTKIYDYGEVSKVVKTTNSHWRYTISTCMTFATTVNTLKEDLSIWQQYTNEFHPHDHQIFTALREKGRSLAVCIPGSAVHTDLTFSGWANQVSIDSWAIDILCKEIEDNLNPELKQYKKNILSDNMQGWEKLKRLDALRSLNL